MHLTQGRITSKIPWTGEPNLCLLEEFRAVWDEFIVELKGELRPLFDREIEGHRKEFQGYPL
jgi:hypothetical protein